MIRPVSHIPALRTGKSRVEKSADDASESAADSRSLAVIGEGAGPDKRSFVDRRRTNRHSSPFLTQLIASNENVEQLRLRRRIEPDLGVQYYTSPVRRERLHAVGRDLELSA